MRLANLRKWMEVRRIEIVGVEDGKLIVSAPTGAMADSVFKVLLAHKKQLITDYKEASMPKVMYIISTDGAELVRQDSVIASVKTAIAALGLEVKDGLPVDTQATARLIEASRRDTICAELARRIGWREDELAGIWFPPDENLERVQTDPPDFFTDAAASRELIAWLAADDARWNKFGE